LYPDGGLYPDGVEPGDRELWDAARAVLARTYRTGRHEVAAAIRTTGGAVLTGVHLAGSAGRSSICAEGAALGAVLAAAPAGRTDLAAEVDSILAVLYRPQPAGGTLRVIAPCGVCRELLADYCPQAWIYVHRWPPGRPPGAIADDSRAPGFGEPVLLADGRAHRLRAGELLPEKNLRPW
jgi:cytidine deaminase